MVGKFHSFKIIIQKGEQIASFQRFDMETEYLLYEYSGHIETVRSGINDPNKNINSESPKHHVELNLEETTLNKQEKKQLQSLVAKYSDCFVNSADCKPGLTDLTECKIETLLSTILCVNTPTISLLL